jgi:hypothetical protein
MMCKMNLNENSFSKLIKNVSHSEMKFLYEKEVY